MHLRSSLIKHDTQYWAVLSTQYWAVLNTGPLSNMILNTGLVRVVQMTTVWLPVTATMEQKSRFPTCSLCASGIVNHCTSRAAHWLSTVCAHHQLSTTLSTMPTLQPPCSTAWWSTYITH